MDLNDLRRSPNALARHYARFRVAERLLLTGHSHQAWPDVALEGQLEAWQDAAEHVDDKWERAAAKADRVREGFAGRIGARPAEIALGTSTHELVVRFLSALPRRQLDALAETRTIEIVKVAALPAAALAERLEDAVDDRTAAVLVSSVLYANAHIVSGL